MPSNKKIRKSRALSDVSNVGDNASVRTPLKTPRRKSNRAPQQRSLHNVTEGRKPQADPRSGSGSLNRRRKRVKKKNANKENNVLKKVEQKFMSKDDKNRREAIKKTAKRNKIARRKSVRAHNVVSKALKSSSQPVHSNDRHYDTLFNNGCPCDNGKSKKKSSSKFTPSLQHQVFKLLENFRTQHNLEAKSYFATIADISLSHESVVSESRRFDKITKQNLKKKKKRQKVKSLKLKMAEESEKNAFIDCYWDFRHSQRRAEVHRKLKHLETYERARQRQIHENDTKRRILSEKYYYPEFFKSKYDDERKRICRLIVRALNYFDRDWRRKGEMNINSNYFKAQVAGEGTGWRYIGIENNVDKIFDNTYEKSFGKKIHKLSRSNHIKQILVAGEVVPLSFWDGKKVLKRRAKVKGAGRSKDPYEVGRKSHVLLENDPDITMIEVDNHRFRVTKKGELECENPIKGISDEMWCADTRNQVLVKLSDLKSKFMNLVTMSELEHKERNELIQMLKKCQYPTHLKRSTSTKAPKFAEKIICNYTIPSNLKKLRDHVHRCWNTIVLKQYGDESDAVKTIELSLQGIGIVWLPWQWRCKQDVLRNYILPDLLWSPQIGSVAKTNGTQDSANVMAALISKQFIDDMIKNPNGVCLEEVEKKKNVITIDELYTRVKSSGNTKTTTVENSNEDDSNQNSDVLGENYDSKKTYIYWNIRYIIGDQKHLSQIAAVSSSNSGTYSNPYRESDCKQRMDAAQELCATPRTILGTACDYIPLEGSRWSKSTGISVHKWRKGLMSYYDNENALTDEREKEIRRMSMNEVMKELMRLTNGARGLSGILAGYTPEQICEMPLSAQRVVDMAETASDMMHVRGESAKNIYQLAVARLKKEKREKIAYHMKKCSILKEGTNRCVNKYLAVMECIRTEAHNILGFGEGARNIFQAFVDLCRLINTNPLDADNRGHKLAIFAALLKYDAQLRLHFESGETKIGGINMTYATMFGMYHTGLINAAVLSRLVSLEQLDCEQWERLFKDIKDIIHNRTNYKMKELVKVLSRCVLAMMIRDRTNRSDADLHRLLVSEVKTLSFALSEEPQEGLFCNIPIGEVAFGVEDSEDDEDLDASYSTTDSERIGEVWRFNASETRCVGWVVGWLTIYADYIVATNRSLDDNEYQKYFQNSDFKDGADTCGTALLCDFTSKTGAHFFSGAHMSVVDLQAIISADTLQILHRRNTHWVVPGWRSADAMVKFLFSEIRRGWEGAPILHKLLEKYDIENIPSLPINCDGIAARKAIPFDHIHDCNIVQFRCPNCVKLLQISKDEGISMVQENKKIECPKCKTEIELHGGVLDRYSSNGTQPQRRDCSRGIRVATTFN
eukprot:g219.t1